MSDLDGASPGFSSHCQRTLKILIMVVEDNVTQDRSDLYVETCTT